LGVCVASIFTFGLKMGVDFTGGSLLSVSFSDKLPAIGDVKEALVNIGMKDASVRSAGTDAYIIRTKEISQTEKGEVLQALSMDGQYSPQEKEFNTVGPVLGSEAINKSWISIVLVILAIVIFVTFVFRTVSRPVSSWVYGIVTILSLVHDVIVPTGAFALFGYFYGFEVDTLFVTAILVVLGFSVHDTIVVFDRIRENLKKETDNNLSKNFENIVGKSVSETIVRSINTSLTTLLAIAILYIFGPEATKHFSETLLIGITAGVYSSIFIASPLLVTIHKWRLKE